MPTYVTLFKWTEQGVKTVKDTMDRTEQARTAVEAVGGRLVSLYWTQGATPRHSLGGLTHSR